ncbi:putative germin-like protein 2-1 [Coffea eugenioides]|uniref:Germin-like protein n=1 Tax=Coffea arabica TaxID=13443 RepID=A0ABM4USD6_COFAR|nr:putative germin-like protein 2-1 [Coffea eugenioides]
MAKNSVLLALLALSFSYLTSAFDPSPLQDFCVAKATTTVKLNGLACKDPSRVHANDFFFRGLHIAGNTSNAAGFGATQVSAAQIRGLNTLGISLVRLDFAPGGINAPHIHPRASEMLTVLDGALEVGFVTSNPDNKLFVKVLQKGDVFVFPVGLVHYQRNVGNSNAVALSGLNSQNPGLVSVASSVFGSEPGISREALAKAFQIDANTVDKINVSKF